MVHAMKTIETGKIANNHWKCIRARCLRNVYNGESGFVCVCVRSVTLKVIFIRNQFAIWNSYLQSHFLLFINSSFACFLICLLSLQLGRFASLYVVQHRRCNEQAHNKKHDHTWTLHAPSLVRWRRFGTTKTHRWRDELEPNRTQ